MDLMDSDSSGGIDDPRTVAREVEKRTQRRLHRWKNHRNAIMDDDDDDDDHDEMNSSDSQKISPIHRHKHIINCSFSDSSDGSFDQLLENLRIKDDSEESSSYTQENCPWPPNVSGPRNDHIDTDSSASMSLSENRDDTVSKSASPVWTTNDEGDYQLLQHPLPKVCIPKPLFDKLYDHQKEGIEFLARLHASGIGGILGDDMVSNNLRLCSSNKMYMHTL
jgi:SNF2 family DNA or RNA helicase